MIFVNCFNLSIFNGRNLPVAAAAWLLESWLVWAVDFFKKNSPNRANCISVQSHLERNRLTDVQGM